MFAETSPQLSTFRIQAATASRVLCDGAGVAGKRGRRRFVWRTTVVK